MEARDAGLVLERFDEPLLATDSRQPQREREVAALAFLVPTFERRVHVVLEQLVDQRLDRVERRLGEIAREIRAQTWKLMTLMVAVVGVVVAAVRL